MIGSFALLCLLSPAHFSSFQQYAIPTNLTFFQYSTRMRKPFQKCLGRKSGKTEDIETGISPKRSTIRVIKSLPNTSLPPTPTAYTKPPVRRFV